MEDRRTTGLAKPSGRTKRTVKLYETLTPGSSAAATVMKWTGAAYSANTVIERITVYDPWYRVFGLKDETIDVEWNADSRRYETTHPHGLWRQGKLTGTLSPHGLATAEVWDQSSAISPTVSVDVNDFLLLTTDTSLATGTRIQFRYDITDKKWKLSGAGCGVE